MTVELLKVAKRSYDIARANLYVQRFENTLGIQMDGKVSTVSVQHKIYVVFNTAKATSRVGWGLKKKKKSQR